MPSKTFHLTDNAVTDWLDKDNITLLGDMVDDKPSFIGQDLFKAGTRVTILFKDGKTFVGDIVYTLASEFKVRLNIHGIELHVAYDSIDFVIFYHRGVDVVLK